MNTTSSCNGTTTSSIASTTPCCFEEQFFDGGAWNEVDSDHNSHYDSCSNNSINNKCNPDYLYWKEPIVVGYAFGPKKMRSMGVVMAEASRVKVIHEELEEDKYDDDHNEGDAEEEEQQQQQHDEVLFCGEDEMANNSSSNLYKNNTNNSMTMDSSPLTRSEHHHQRTPSLLTRAALRDHCPAPQSTIITLGNTNDTDLQHIVRYFRSSCSSAAASTSIASVSETTVSTPTTTNSYTTNVSSNNSKHQQQQQRRRGGERNRFPVQISFVPIDPDQKIEDQHGGNFDLILHKLTEDILSCSLMQDSIEKSQYPEQQPHVQQQQQQQQQDLQQKIEDDPSWKRVHALRDYCYNQNRNCCLVDDPKHVQTVMSRSEIANVLKQCLKDVNTTSGIPVKSPRFVVIPERLPPSSQQQQNQNQTQTQELKQALHDNNQGGDTKMLSTPLIVKPLIAAGTKQSHCLSIALKESALSKLPPRSIVQEFVNHDATLYKVYVLGDFVSVYERHSLPNLPADLSNATVDLVEFDSQRPYPKLKDFGLDVVEVNNNNTCTSSKSTDINTASCTSAGQHPSASSTSSAPVHVPVTVHEVKPIVDVLKKAFGLELFGFDILIGSNNGDCFVVDVNYFPSYKEVPNFPSLLAQYLTQRVLEQRRKGRMYNNINTSNSTETGTTTAATTAAVTQEEDYSGSKSESNAIVPPSKSKNDLER